MKQKTKTSLVIAILFGIFIAFFEAKTEWLVSHTRDLEREVHSMKIENEQLKDQLDYVWYIFNFPEDWDIGEFN